MTKTENRRKKFTLTSRWFIIIVCTLLLGANVGLGVTIMYVSQRSMLSQMHLRMIDIAEVAAQSVDGDVFDSITEEDYKNNSENYQEVYNCLSNYQTINEVVYVYAVRAIEDSYVFVVDPDPETPSELFHEEVVYTAALHDAYEEGTPSVDKEASEDRWGRFYSAFCPVYDNDNNIVGVIGVDYSAVWYDKQVLFGNVSYIVLSAFSLLIGGAIVFLITVKVRKRLKALYLETSSLATDLESLTDEIRKSADESVDEIAFDTDVAQARPSTGETIEALGRKVSSMRNDLRKYIYHVHAQAYTDTMTGVGNKTAYMDTVNVINKKIKDGINAFSVVLFDINGLKAINDNYGHECGDLIITDAASVIVQVFDQKQVFRIGGDEFVAILETDKLDVIKEAIAALDRKVEEFNQTTKEYKTALSFSRGYSIFDPNTDTEFREVFKRADEAMYRNKEKYYSKKSEARRYRNSESGVTD